jgi:hypothetical protein
MCCPPLLVTETAHPTDYSGSAIHRIPHLETTRRCKELLKQAISGCFDPATSVGTPFA